MRHDETRLRRLLCSVYSKGRAYMDDGEAQDAQRFPIIDFLRDSIQDIEAKMRERMFKEVESLSQRFPDLGGLEDYLTMRARSLTGAGAGADEAKALRRWAGEISFFMKLLKDDRPPVNKDARPQRRVVCAAVRSASGQVLLGVRHYSADMHEQIDRRQDGQSFTHRHDPDQGFVDQWGVYMDRREAFKVAQEANQIIRLHACRESSRGWELYSEGAVLGAVELRIEGHFESLIS